MCVCASVSGVYFVLKQTSLVYTKLLGPEHLHVCAAHQAEVTDLNSNVTDKSDRIAFVNQQ